MQRRHLIILACTACSGNRRKRIGLVQGRLRPCRLSPDCGSSQGTAGGPKQFADATRAGQRG